MCTTALQTEILNTSRFNENSHLSTTYLGRSDKARNNKLKAEESFPISEHGYTSGKLLDGTECQLLLDTGVSKSFMSKSFYMQYKSQICIKTSTDTSGKWSVCRHIVCYTSNHRCAQTYDLKFTH